MMTLKFASITACLFTLGTILGCANKAPGNTAAIIQPPKPKAASMSGADRFLDIADARVRVRVEGNPDGPALLFLHGYTSSLDSWDYIVSAFASDYKIVRYDLLGHGLTGPDPSRRYSPMERVEFIDAVLQALDIERVTIVGNSLGGLMAWRYAAMHPNKVDQLVLIAPAAFPFYGLNDKPQPVLPAFEKYLRFGTAEDVFRVYGTMLGDSGKATEERTRLYHAMMRHPGNGQAFIDHLNVFTLPDPRSDLAKVAAPTLILWGNKDAIITSTQAERIAAAMPNARARIFEGVGHIPQEEVPEQTTAAIKAFLATDNKKGS